MTKQSFARLWLPLLAGLICLLSGLAIYSSQPAGVSVARERVFDLYQRVSPRLIGADLPIRIVDVDDASLASYGQWPWPRTRLADLVDTLNQAGAAAIAFDMIFPEPDRASPLLALEGMGLPEYLDAEVRSTLQQTLGFDERFAQSLALAPIVLGVAVSAEGSSFTPAAGLAMVGPDPAPFLVQSQATIASLPVLNEAAQGLGGIHVSAEDDDAVVRRIPVLTQVGAGTASPSLLPSMFVEALRVAQGAQSLILRTNPSPHDPQFGIPQDLGVGALTVPLTRAGTYRILYGDLDEAMTLSAREVLASTDNPQELAPRIGGTIVLIGSSAPGLFDLRATPLGTIVPGVSMHAQAIAGVLSGANLARPDWTTGLELMVMIVAGALIIATALLTRPLVAAAILGIVVVAIGAGSWWAFSEQRLLIDASFPILLTLLTYGAVTVPVLVGTDRRQRFIRNAFAHYLAEPVLARLEADPDALTLDGERRSVTIMFMDVRGFTSRSEHMQPTQAVDLLNTLLDPLSEAVLVHEGTIDKFMGDGMMAFWNAPLDQTDHAARAVRAAKAMVDVVADVNAELSPGEKPLAIGIGLHTGEAFVGNMGSKRRFAYSAIGDPVNLAARVEALAGTLGEALLITQETLDHAKESQADLATDFTSAGDHQVKGRNQPVTVYKLRSEELV